MVQDTRNLLMAQNDFCINKILNLNKDVMLQKGLLPQTPTFVLAVFSVKNSMLPLPMQKGPRHIFFFCFSMILVQRGPSFKLQDKDEK